MYAHALHVGMLHNGNGAAAGDPSSSQIMQLLPLLGCTQVAVVAGRASGVPPPMLLRSTPPPALGSRAAQPPEVVLPRPPALKPLSGYRTRVGAPTAAHPSTWPWIAHMQAGAGHGSVAEPNREKVRHIDRRRRGTVTRMHSAECALHSSKSHRIQQPLLKTHSCELNERIATSEAWNDPSQPR
jgi:hypothetical protein